MNSTIRNLSTVALFCCCCQLSAQIVNIEDRRQQATDSLAWFGRADLGFNLTDNGNEILNLRFGGQLERHLPARSFLLLGELVQGVLNSERYLNEGVTHLRYNQKLREKVTWEAFGQLQFNEKLRIELRGLLGTGPRFTLADRERQKAFLGVLYMYEYDDVWNSNLFFRDHRLSAYLSFRLGLGKQASLSSTNYYQPVLTDWSTARLSSRTALDVKISDRLSLTSTFSISYDSRLGEEVPDVVKTVYSLVNGLRLSF